MRTSCTRVMSVLNDIHKGKIILNFINKFITKKGNVTHVCILFLLLLSTSFTVSVYEWLCNISTHIPDLFIIYYNGRGIPLPKQNNNNYNNTNNNKRFFIKYAATNYITLTLVSIAIHPNIICYPLCILKLFSCIARKS